MGTYHYAVTFFLTALITITAPPASAGMKHKIRLLSSEEGTTLPPPSTNTTEEMEKENPTPGCPEKKEPRKACFLCDGVDSYCETDYPQVCCKDEKFGFCCDDPLVPKGSLKCPLLDYPPDQCISCNKNLDCGKKTTCCPTRDKNKQCCIEIPELNPECPANTTLIEKCTECYANSMCMSDQCCLVTTKEGGPIQRCCFNGSSGVNSNFQLVIASSILLLIWTSWY